MKILIRYYHGWKGKVKRGLEIVDVLKYELVMINYKKGISDEY